MTNPTAPRRPLTREQQAEQGWKELQKRLTELSGLDRSAAQAAALRDRDAFTALMGDLASLHVELAQRYRTWLAMQQGPVPVQPGPVDGMSV
jgi:hypothetical protein